MLVDCFVSNIMFLLGHNLRASRFGSDFISHLTCRLYKQLIPILINARTSYFDIVSYVRLNDSQLNVRMHLQSLLPSAPSLGYLVPIV